MSKTFDDLPNIEVSAFDDAYWNGRDSFPR